MTLIPTHLLDIDYLKTVKGWLDSHPNEVLTFVFTNPEGKSPKDIWAPAFVNSGIAPLAYVPPTKPLKQSAWPTLGQMIDSRKRVVVFMDSGADNGGVDYILPEFPMVSGTQRQVFFTVDNSLPGLGNALQCYGFLLPLQGRPNRRAPARRGPHVHDQPLAKHQVVWEQ